MDGFVFAVSTPVVSALFLYLAGKLVTLRWK
jgi:hypothetical protein